MQDLTMFGLPAITIAAAGGAVIVVIALLLYWAFLFREVA
jgi:hypothetical protein